MTYSLDLINATINYYKANNSSLRNTSKIFGVSKSIINYWLKKLPIKYLSSKNKEKSIDIKILNFIKRSLDHNPFQTQTSMKNKINKKFNMNISISIIKNALKIIGYTKKKVSRKLYNRNLKNHILNQKEFMNKIKTINKKDIICLDEVGVNRNTYNNYGYIHKSKRLQYYVDINKLIKNKSLIVAITNDKVIQYISYNKSINGELFKKFILELVKKVQNKYILMDNVQFHKNKEILKIITESNNIPLFIPPYSPEFNPIEEVFSHFKSYLKKHINIVTGFLQIEKCIEKFFMNTFDFNKYYNRAFD